MTCIKFPPIKNNIPNYLLYKSPKNCINNIDGTYNLISAYKGDLAGRVTVKNSDTNILSFENVYALKRIFPKVTINKKPTSTNKHEISVFVDDRSLAANTMSEFIRRIMGINHKG